LYIFDLPRANRDRLPRTTGLEFVGMYCTVVTYCPKMTVKQSYLKVAERTGLPPDKVQKAVEGIMKLAAERMKAGEEFVLADMISLKKTKGNNKTVKALCMHKLFVDAGLKTVIPLPEPEPSGSGPAKPDLLD